MFVILKRLRPGKHKKAYYELVLSISGVIHNLLKGLLRSNMGSKRRWPGGKGSGAHAHTLRCKIYYTFLTQVLHKALVETRLTVRRHNTANDPGRLKISVHKTSKYRKNWLQICCFGSRLLSAMAKHPWFWTLTLLTLLVGLAPWSFLLPSKFSQRRSSARISRAAVGLSTFSTGAALLEKIDRDRSIGPLEELGCEVRWSENTII